MRENEFSAVEEEEDAAEGESEAANRILQAHLLKPRKAERVAPTEEYEPSELMQQILNLRQNIIDKRLLQPVAEAGQATTDSPYADADDFESQDH